MKIKQLLIKLKNVFGFSSRLNVQIMAGSIISQDSVIGEHSYIGHNTFISKAIIGRYCSIANNVSIGNGEHLIHKVSTSSLFYDKPYDVLTSKDCLIGNDVWIGVDSIIRRGVTIGNGAIIGANSFVNKDVPPFAIVAGNPAKIIKFRFSPEQIDIIEKSNWWNYDLQTAKNIVSQTELQVNTNN